MFVNPSMMPKGVYVRSEDTLKRLRAQGRKNVESGEIAWLNSHPKRSEWSIKGGTAGGWWHRTPEAKSMVSVRGKQAKNVERMRRFAVVGGQAAAAKLRHMNGPNKEETKLYDEMERLGLPFDRERDREINLGKDMGVVDVLVGKIVGELDGSGHFVNFGRKRGISDDECKARILAKDARHDELRRQAGFTVVRDSDPVRLAERIAAAVLED
jgi:hypothetical protein